ncbi:MAG: hypothetical protein KAQ88_04495 [Hyphomicrobiaceae bacterium]|nr:hypothetical protein [Hyphomicrobiaceae bacterium]
MGLKITGAALSACALLAFDALSGEPDAMQLVKAPAAVKGLCENFKSALMTEIKAGGLRGAFTVTNK